MWLLDSLYIYFWLPLKLLWNWMLHFYMKLFESFKKTTLLYTWSGGGIGLACALIEGGPQNACTCVQRGGGGQKRPKTCVRTKWTAPNFNIYWCTLVLTNISNEIRKTHECEIFNFSGRICLLLCSGDRLPEVKRTQTDWDVVNTYIQRTTKEHNLSKAHAAF